MAAQFSRPARYLDKNTGKMVVNREPSLYDFKGCGEIENKSNTALLLSYLKEDIEDGKHLLKCNIAKCRDGEKGVVNLVWDWKKTKLEEIK